MELINKIKNKLKSINISDKKKRIIILSIFVVVWIATVLLTLNYYKDSLGKESSGNDQYYKEVCELNKETSVMEIFPVKKEPESVSILFATYARKNVGEVSITVTGYNSKHVYLRETFDVKDLEDNIYKTFKLNKKVVEDYQLVLELKSTSEVGEGVGVYYSVEKDFTNSTLKINDEVLGGDLQVRYLYENETLDTFTKIIIATIIIGLSAIILLIVFDLKYEVLFTIIALIYGLIFMVIITPLSPPDEQTHYEYTLQLSNIIMGEEEYQKIDKKYISYGDYSGHENVSIAYEGLMEHIGDDLELSGKLKKMPHDIKDDIYILSYAPQAIGVTIARLLKANIKITFYSGRLTNLLFYCLCLYIGIKKTSSNKLLFGVLATMPVLIQQAASYSYDCLLMSLLIVTAGYFSNWYFKEGTITRREIIEMFIVSLLLAPCKVVYSMFIFLFWFVSADKFGDKKRKRKSTLLICAPVIYNLLLILFLPILQVIFSILGIKIADNGFAINTILADTTDTIVEKIEEERKLYDIEYMMENLGQTIMVYIRTIRFYLKNWFYDSIGKTLSGMTLLVPIRFVHIQTILIILSTLVKEENIFSLPVKGFSLLVSIGVGMFALTGMLITWTYRDDTMIQGIQGRYFSPLLFYVFPVLTNKKIQITQKIDKYIIFTQLIVMFEVMIYILSFTFVN